MTANPRTPTEASPLLPETQQPQRPAATSRFHVTTPRNIVLLLALNILILASAGGLTVVPQTRLLEDIFCHRYYGDIKGLSDIDESLCKIDSIQSELAYVNGLTTAVEAVVGMTFAFPFGILADKIGRKPVYMISMIGTTLYLVSTMLVIRFWRFLPVHLVIFCSIFQIIGGGTQVLLAVLYSIAADVESSAHRASAFFLLALASYVGNLIGPLVSSMMMEVVSPWVPLLSAIALVPIGVSTFIFIPETLRKKDKDDDEDDDTLQESPSAMGSVISHFWHTLTQLSESFSMLKSPSLTIILFSFVVQMSLFFGKSTFFIQYFSKRFQWSLAKTGYLLSYRGIISVAVLVVILPGISRLLLSPNLRFRYSAAKKDLVLAQCSAVLMILGYFCIGGPTVPIVFVGIIVATLGDGQAPLCRSLLTAYIDPQHTSRIYVLVGIVEALGSMYAGPALAAFFTVGMSWKGLWLGLPYFWLAFQCSLVALGLCFVNLRSAIVGKSAESEEEQDGLVPREEVV
ncbi:major facilitator superfamily domain-containing protein [Cadophora sp. MPI-SDFR-AT-0126]|nr:major facilitator superfamily domain-containing protein [Leotiomycetes sp. MPI-SDFR-AT-0126]